MATVGILDVVLTASAGGLISVLNRAKGEIRAFSVAAASADGITSRFGIAATGLQGVALGLVGSIGRLGQSMVETAADFEHTAISMEAMTGSATTAKKLLADLAAFSLRTPFQVQDLNKSAQAILSYGIAADQVVPILERLGNLAAASPFGVDQSVKRMTIALGQMLGKNRVMTQEMNQFTEAGATGVWESLAKRLGTDVAGAMAAVAARSVSAKDGISALMDLAESPRFAQTMAKQSLTLKGLFSNLQDQTNLTARDIGQIIIEGFDLKGTVRAVGGFLNDLRSRVDGLRSPLMIVGALFGALRDIALTAARSLVDALRQWGLSIDASAGRLGGLRQMVIGAFETAALWVNRAANQLVRFGGHVLEFVVIPIIKADEMMLRLGATLASLPGIGDKTLAAVFTQMANEAARAQAVVLKTAEGLIAQPLDKGADAIRNFFRLVEQSPLRTFIEQFRELKDAATGVALALRQGGPAGGAVALVKGVNAVPSLLKAVGLMQSKPGELNLNFPDLNKKLAPPVFPEALTRGTAAELSANLKFERAGQGIKSPEEKQVDEQVRTNTKLDGVNQNLRKLFDVLEGSAPTIVTFGP